MRSVARIAVAALACFASGACGGRVRIEPAPSDAGGADGRAMDAGTDEPDARRNDARADDDAGPDSRVIDAELDARSGDAGADSSTDDAAVGDAGADLGRSDAGMCARPGIGQPCGADCDDGLVCDDGVCRASCTDEPCCSDFGIACLEGSSPTTSVCSEGCALVDDSVCGPGLGCRFFPIDGTLDVLTYCDAVDDTRHDGDPCERTEQCPRGGVCVGFGYCATMCRSEAGSCGDDRTCFNFMPHARFGSSEYGYCSARCTFAPDEGCAAGTTCFPVIDSRFGPARYYAQCRPVGAGGEGDPCADYRSCGAGMVCAESACRSLCRRDVPADCPAGTSCRGFEPAIVTTDSEIGFCSSLRVD